MTKAEPAHVRRGRRAFTLVEIMIAITLSAFLIAAVMGTTLYLVRNGIRLSQHAETDAEIRRSLEALSNDVRKASALTWNSNTAITLTLPDAAGSSSLLTYAWDSSTGTFYAVSGANPAAATGRIVLLRHSPTRPDGSPGVRFTRLDKEGAAATTDNATKRIQVSITTWRRSSSALLPVGSTGSATLILRNKTTSP